MNRVADPVIPKTLEHDYAYYCQALKGTALPAAFLDLDHFEANLRSLQQRAGDLPIRLVTKSVRSVAVLRRVLDSAPFFRGLLCYSVAEAAWLASEGFDDLVVAYPSVEVADIEAAAEQVRQGKQITLMVDSVAQVERIHQIGLAYGVVLPLCIDLDMSSAFPMLYFGVRRSPIRDASSALALATEIAKRSKVRLDGVMGYEGQIAGLMDQIPGQRLRSMIIRFLKRKSIAEVHRRRQAVVQALRSAGFELRFVNGGGSGSFESTRLDCSVTELAAGSALYAPMLFDHYAAFKLQPAAGFAVPVTRRPTPEITTCSGGGYIASGPIGKNRLPQPWLPSGCRLIDNEGAGEVQTPVLHTQPVSIGIGDPILFRHAKAGELCERFNQLNLIQRGRVVQVANTYRGDGKSFF